MYRLVIDSHLRRKRVKKICYVVYDLSIRNFIVVQKDHSDYYQKFIKGDYRSPLIPFLLKSFNKSELFYIKAYLSNEPQKLNRLFRDRDYILKYMPLDIENYKEHSYDFPTYDDLKQNLKMDDLLWKSTTPIKDKKELFDGSKCYVYYYMIVTRKMELLSQNSAIKIVNEPLSNYSKCYDRIMSVFISMKEIKTNFNHDIINKAKFIRDYIGVGSYTILENGNVIVIINDLNEEKQDCRAKLENLRTLYGKRLRYHYINTIYGKDLVIQLNPV